MKENDIEWKHKSDWKWERNRLFERARANVSERARERKTRDDRITMPIKAKGVGNIFITTIMGIICDNLLLAFRRKRTNKPMDINAQRTNSNHAMGIKPNERKFPNMWKRELHTHTHTHFEQKLRLTLLIFR